MVTENWTVLNYSWVPSRERPYIIVHIFAQFRSVRRHWKRSVAEDTKQYFVSERKKICGPGDHLSSREQGHDHVRREHWHPARILSVGI